MAKITTSKGGAVLRPMLLKHENLIGRLLLLEGQAENTLDYFRIKAEMTAMLDEATVSAEWEGGFGELPKDEAFKTLIKWSNATDEEAVPPASGTDSATT